MIHLNGSETRDTYMAVDFYFRLSQKKFDIQPEEERLCRLEVVKYSSPVPIFLNKPLINILDQVDLLICSLTICFIFRFLNLIPSIPMRGFVKDYIRCLTDMSFIYAQH
jgi:hypothetical protein